VCAVASISDIHQFITTGSSSDLASMGANAQAVGFSRDLALFGIASMLIRGTRARCSFPTA
jgi:hypothetical protein